MSGMKWTLCLSIFLLTACSSRGHRQPLAVTHPISACEKPKDTFLQDGKVQTAGGEARGDDEVIGAGRLLNAVVENACANPGEISAAVERDDVAAGLPGVRSYPLSLPRDMSIDELRTIANADPCLRGLADATVSYIGEDGVDAIPADPLVSEQGHMKMLSVEDAYPEFYDPSLGKRRSVVVAIIDTGADLRHEDLRENIWTNTDEIPGNGIDDDRNGYIDDVHGYNFASRKGDPTLEGNWKGNYHGTHVAGLAAARGFNNIGVAGVMAAGVRIMVLNVFGAAPGAYSSDTENALRYAADNGADVVNLSIGGGAASASYKAALEYAVRKGVTVLAAAGNERRELGKGYFMTPGAYGSAINGLITIGAVDALDSRWSTYSNFSSEYVELASPGSENSRNYVGLLATMPGDKYARLQGTSMATPVAAGAAALAIQYLRVRGYEATPQRVELALHESGIQNASLATKVKGGRTLNLKRLAEYISVHYPKLKTPEPIGKVEPPPSENPPAPPSAPGSSPEPDTPVVPCA